MIKSIVPIDTMQGDNMYFKRLRDLREDHDMKQSEVAEYLGIQQTVYSRYERGFQSIPVEHLIKLAGFVQSFHRLHSRQKIVTN